MPTFSKSSVSDKLAYIVVAQGGDVIKRTSNLSVAMLAAFGRYFNGEGSAIVFDLRSNRIVAETPCKVE